MMGDPGEPGELPRAASGWRRYRDLPAPSRRLLREALAQLLAARLMMALVPFRRLAAWLGELDVESSPEASEAHRAMAGEIGWAIRVMAHRVPWDGRCLAQALAGYRMLRRRGISATVYFGVKQGPGPFDAHAWLRCGDCLVTGGEGHEAYQVLCRFTRPSGP